MVNMMMNCRVFVGILREDRADPGRTAVGNASQTMGNLGI